MRKSIKYIFAAASALLLGFAASAQNPEVTKNGVTVNKNVKDEGNGVYTLTLESYATGLKEAETKQRPLDVVLVLDVSRSMRNYGTWWIGYDSVSGSYSYNSDVTGLYALDNGTYYQVNKTFYYYIGGERRLYYTKNSQTVYLTDDNRSANLTLYRRVSKESALKNAVDTFIAEIAEHSDSGENAHRVSLVSFGDEAKNFVTLTSNFDYARQQVRNNLPQETYTDVKLGMESAQGIIKGITRDSDKIVVMFTDGEPRNSDSSNNFDEVIANSAISISNALKNDYSVKVYTIGVFTDLVEEGNVGNYMNYVSSNYNNATSVSSTGLTPSGSGYYATASTADALNEIFQNIANAVGQADNTEVGASTQVLDEMTNAFMVPRSASGSIDLNNVVIKVADLDESKSEFTVNSSDKSDRSGWAPVFQTPRDVKKGTESMTDADKAKYGDIQVSSKAGANGEDQIIVTGFDFSKWFVGPSVEIDGTTITPVNNGAKLVIEITIVQNPDYTGDTFETNTSKSGVYVAGNLTTPVVAYPVPEAAGEVKLTVTRSGLINGEAATYTVSAKVPDGFSQEDLDKVFKTVQLYLDRDATETIKVKSALQNGEGVNVPIEYTVTESSWDWTYTPGGDKSKTQSVNSANKLKFEFSGTKKSDITTKYVEKKK